MLIFFGILLFIGPANTLDNKIVHELPYGYYSSDALWHYTFSDTITINGNFKYYPYSYNGGFENIVAYNPGAFYQLSSLFASLTKIQTYDSVIFLIYIFGILAILIFYLAIRTFNKTIAIFSLPLSVLIFAKSFKIGFYFGLWLYIAGAFFLILSLYVLTKLDLKYSFILLGISLAAVINTHVPEFIYLVGFIILFFIIKLIMKQFDKTQLKSASFGIILALIISTYYLIIFKFVWMDRSPFTFSMKKFSEFAGSIYPTIAEFNYILLIIIAAGMLISLFLLKDWTHPAVLGAFFMFIVGFTHLIGFEHRALQNRYFWPIFLSIFFGIALYSLFNIIVKKHRQIIAITLSLILIFTFTFIFYEKNDNPGLMDAYHWSAFNFLEEKTPERAKVSVLWGDVYDQKAILTNTKRQTFYVIQNDYFQAIQNRQIKKEYDFDVITEQMSPKRTGLFSFEFLKQPLGFHDLCEFDFYVIEALPDISRIPAAIQYNLLLRQELLKNDFITEVFNNQVTSILQNKNPGADCIEAGNF